MGIKKVTVMVDLYSAVWTRSNTYAAVESVPLAQSDVIYEKEFPKDARIEDVWDDLRSGIMSQFFTIFYPAVVEQTKPPNVTTDNPDIARVHQTGYIQSRLDSIPEFYMWNERQQKWHMNPEGYNAAVGDLEVAYGESEYGNWFEGDGAIMQLSLDSDKYKGTTQYFYIFVYPDRYDEDVRAQFILIIEFW